MGLSLLLCVSLCAGCGESTTAGDRNGMGRSKPAVAASVDASQDPSTPANPPPNGQSRDPATQQAALSPARIRDATFDDLKFDMAPSDRFRRDMLTAPIEQMFGARIRIRGYMLPALRSKGLKQFVLVRDNMECCFGPGAALYDCILVTMQPGVTTDYTIRQVAVEGVLEFFEHGPPGETVAIYQMEADKVN